MNDKNTTKFINDLANKDYSSANVSLTKMLENKLKAKIKQIVTKNQDNLDK
jgi:hypothetical protein